MLASMSADESAAVSPDNPLRSISALPYRLPPFADITPEHLREALLAGMAEQRAEVAAIAASAEAATFENTIVALERSGALLTRAWNVFGNLTSSVSTPRLREIEREIAPLEAAHDDADPPRPGAVRPHRRGARRARRGGARRRVGAAGRAVPPGLRAAPVRRLDEAGRRG